MITINNTAKKHILTLMINEGFTTERWFLRVGVKGGGCSGLSYVMDFDDTITEMDEVVDLNTIKIIIKKLMNKIKLYLHSYIVYYILSSLLDD